MTRRGKPSPAPNRKVSAKPVLPDLKPSGARRIKGGKGSSTTTRRKDPYSNFNF